MPAWGPRGVAREIQEFQVTVPAGTPASAPLLSSIATPIRVVTRIDWRVPRGPMGTLAFLIAMGGVPVLPLPAGTYVVADGESGTWLVDGQPDSGAWQVKAYNTGAYPHSVYVTLYCDLTSPPDQLTPMLAPWSITDAPDLSRRGPPVRRPA